LRGKPEIHIYMEKGNLSFLGEKEKTGKLGKKPLDLNKDEKQHLISTHTIT